MESPVSVNIVMSPPRACSYGRFLSSLVIDEHSLCFKECPVESLQHLFCGVKAGGRGCSAREETRKNCFRKKELRAQKRTSESFSGCSDISSTSDVSNASPLTDELSSPSGELAAALAALSEVDSTSWSLLDPLKSYSLLGTVHTKMLLHCIAGWTVVPVTLVSKSLSEEDVIPDDNVPFWWCLTSGPVTHLYWEPQLIWGRPRR